MKLPVVLRIRRSKGLFRWMLLALAQQVSATHWLLLASIPAVSLIVVAGRQLLQPAPDIEVAATTATGEKTVVARPRVNVDPPAVPHPEPAFTDAGDLVDLDAVLQVKYAVTTDDTVVSRAERVRSPAADDGDATMPRLRAHPDRLPEPFSDADDPQCNVPARVLPMARLRGSDVR